MRQLSVILASLFASTALAGCDTLVTSQSAPTGATTAAGMGVAYALPKGQVQITAVRSPPDPMAVATASDTLASASMALANDQAALAKDRSAAAPDAVRVATERTTLANDQMAVNAATAALAAAGAWQESATLTLLPPAPDGDVRYVANLKHSPLRDDNVQLTVSGGLLSSATIVSTDQTPAIVASIIETAATLVIAGGPGGGPAVPGFEAAPETCAAYSYAGVFDPLNDAEWRKVHDELQAFDPNLELDVDAHETAPHARQTADSDQAKAGIVYRIPATVSVRTKQRKSTKCPIGTVVTSQTLQATVPDSRSAFVVSPEAGPFTTTSLQYGFSNGMLVSYSAQRPSELAAAWKVVPTILNTVPQMVAQVLQARVNLDNAKTALVNADSALAQAKLQAQTSLLSAEAALDAQIAALKNEPINQAADREGALTALENARASLANAIKAANAAAPPAPADP